MKTPRVPRFSLALWALAAGLTLTAAPALAQSSVPSYATQEETIHGTISGLDGARGLFVRDDRGFVDRITLRDGTIINPTGLRLASGMTVSILGRSNGATFLANQIDTSYHSEAAVPAYPYPAYGYAVPAFPAYGYAVPAYPYAYPAYRYPVGVAPFYGGPRYRIGIGFHFR